MLGFLVYGLTAPLYYGVKAASRAGRRSRSYRPRAPHYSHGYCTIAHRSEGAAQRCAMTAAYRRVEAAAIAAERQRAREAAQREGERQIAAAMKRARRQRLARERKARWLRRREATAANLKWVWIQQRRAKENQAKRGQRRQAEEARTASRKRAREERVLARNARKRASEEYVSVGKARFVVGVDGIEDRGQTYRGRASRGAKARRYCRRWSRGFWLLITIALVALSTITTIHAAPTPAPGADARTVAVGLVALIGLLAAATVVNALVRYFLQRQRRHDERSNAHV